MSNNGPSWVTDPQVASGAGTSEGGTPSWLQEEHGGHTATDAATTPPPLQVEAATASTQPNETSTDYQSHTQKARHTTWAEFWRNSFARDGRTILITLLVLVVMNIPYIKWSMYPFTVFSTWIHELCHGLAALMAGGTIVKLELFPDTSGLATYTLPNDRFAFVTSAGYQGTAVIGMFLLTIRRTKRGPRTGTLLIALMMLISVILWVRNAFGIIFILGMATLLVVAAIWFNSLWIRNLYVLMAVTCALNAITSVRVLFGDKGQVNGQDVVSDAQAMADLTKGASRTMWALIWFCLALGLAFFGLVFAIPGPDQSADFTLCGMCQDIGCFYICNAQGRRLCSTLFGRNNKDKTEEQSSDNKTDVV